MAFTNKNAIGKVIHVYWYLHVSKFKANQIKWYHIKIKTKRGVNKKDWHLKLIISEPSYLIAAFGKWCRN